MAQDHQPRVLNVNDEAAPRLALTHMLTRAGFRVDEAATGADALRAAFADAPDVILLDVQLPDLSGYEVCRRLKTDPATAAIPVIHISARFTGSDDRSHGLEGGADAYLVSPAQPRELAATVHALLRLRKAEAEARVLARQWQVTFDALRDAVALTDPAGRVRRANRALLSLLGRTATQVEGGLLADLLATLPGPGAFPILPTPDSPAAGHPREFPAGSRWFRLTSDPVRDDAGRLTGWVHVLADITDARRAETAERDRQLREQQLAELKAEMDGLRSLGRQFSSSSDP